MQRRLAQNAKVQEGDEPAEDPRDLLEEFDRVVADLETLIQRINRTNSETEVESGVTLTDALATRDQLRAKFGAYRNLADEATVTASRYSRSEVKFVSTVDVKEIQSRADEFAKEHRELDAKIQSTNWQTELIE